MIDYKAIQGKADKAFKKLGFPVSVMRGTSKVGSGYGVFTENKTAYDQTTRIQSALAAQTAFSHRTLLLSGSFKAPLVGDSVVSEKETFLVKSVEALRPTDTTLLYTLEVI